MALGPYSQDDKRTALLDAAIRVFGQKGYYETKVADIAVLAGVAKGTVYLYFSSKEELFRAMMLREFEHYEAAVDRIVANPDLVFRQKIYQLADLHLRYFHERRDWGKLFSVPSNNDPDFLGKFHAFIMRYLKQLTHVMEEANIEQPGAAAHALSGVLDAFKREIMMNPAFSSGMIKDRVEYAANLFAPEKR